MQALVKKLYAPRIQEARVRFERTAGSAILDPTMRPDEVTLFLIHFSSIGVKMTEPVEGWIRRAGERAAACGLTALGRALTIHARHEANHHLMMIEDTKRLVQYWNRGHAERLDAEKYLDATPPDSVARYVRLHEDVIASDAPFAQIAIEYEIEGLSAAIGPKFIQHCVSIAGKEIVEGLSFIEEHAAIDVGHTLFNELELEKLLTLNAGYLDTLVRAGAEALDAYGGFLTDALARARMDARQLGRTETELRV